MDVNMRCYNVKTSYQSVNIACDVNRLVWSYVLESVTNDSTKVLYFTNQQSNFTSPCCFGQTFVTYRCVVLDPKCVTLN